MPFAPAARLDPEWGVLLSDDALRKVVGAPCRELHGFWAWGVLGVRASVPHWAISGSRDVARVGWDVNIFFFFILGFRFFVFRHGVVRRKCDALVLIFVGLGVDGCFSSGSNDRDWVQSVGGMKCSRVREGACGSFLRRFGFRFDVGLGCRGRCICPSNVAVRVGDVGRVPILGVWGVEIFGVSHGLGFRGFEIFGFFRENVWWGEWRGFRRPSWFLRGLHFLRR